MCLPQAAPSSLPVSGWSRQLTCGMSPPWVGVSSGHRLKGTHPPRKPISLDSIYLRRRYVLDGVARWAPQEPRREDQCPCQSPRGSALFHEPTVTDHERLAGQRVARGAGEIEHGLGDLLVGRELPVDGPLQHHVLDDVRFADAQFLGLLGDLPFDQWRSYEARGYHVGADIVLRAFLCDYPRQPEDAVLGGHVSRLQRRCFLRV